MSCVANAPLGSAFECVVDGAGYCHAHLQPEGSCRMDFIDQEMRAQREEWEQWEPDPTDEELEDEDEGWLSRS